MKRRIVPCLDIKDGKVVKGVRFEGLKEMGDPIELAREYDRQGADCIVLLDIAGSPEGRPLYLKIVQEVCARVQTPVAAGGGIRRFEDIAPVFEAGATQVAMASAALKDPELIARAAQTYGSERIIVAIDAAKKADASGYELVLAAGKERLAKDPLAWAKEAEKLGAGEILLTSLDADGGQEGYDLELTNALAQALSIPVIASGGAGSLQDFVDVFNKTGASAALAASLFHQGQVRVDAIRQALKEV